MYARCIGRILPAVGLLLLTGGCQTDSLWAEGKIQNAPVTRLDDPEGVNIPPIQLADAREVDLVEEVLTHRAIYYRTLRVLRDYYRDHGYEDKRRWAESEIRAVERIQPFRYLYTGEVPQADLQPVESVAAADTLYTEGLALMKQGGHGVPALYREDKMLQALNKFVTLVRRYPSSDKIDDAAFYCGEIHKEYLKNQEPLAVQWYERAFTWDPNTPHPARFQAAVVYDFRLHDRSRALELYQQVLDLETDNQSNVNFSVKRIGQLTRMPPDDVPSDAQLPQDDLTAEAPPGGGAP